MIKSNELRVGNIFKDRFCEGDDEWFQLYGLDEKRIWYGNLYSCIYEEALPIPLTEEWLLKFGFRYEGGLGYKAPHNTEHWYFTLRNGFMPNACARGSIKSDKYIGCQYVHQLQNLYFALTGTELTIQETIKVA